VAVAEEKWEDALTSNSVTPMHLLHPTNLTIEVDKCLITDDPRLPKLKVTGSLPNVAVNITGNSHLFLMMLYTPVFVKS
jgi:vacuolar protein sorting-associated protein 13A/C